MAREIDYWLNDINGRRRPAGANKLLPPWGIKNNLPPTFKGPWRGQCVGNVYYGAKDALPHNAKPPPRQIPEAQSAPDQWVPDPLIAKEFHTTLMGLYRWTHDAKLGFPPPIKIRNRNFRSRRAIEEFKARMMRAAITQRAE